MRPIMLPQLRSLAIKARSMGKWADGFFRNVCMPILRILILDRVGPDPDESDWGSDGDSQGGILEALARFTDRNIVKISPSYRLELDELHFLNFSHNAGAALVHRLYTQMTTVKVLTLGPSALDRNAALAMGLLPARSGLPDLPLPALPALILFDVPRDVVRRIVLQRMSVAGSLEELFYREKEDKRVPNDWRHQAKKYHRIGSLKSFRYSDIVGRRWSELW
ncbi:hypothetical protein K503DRAFT_225958 [Rhizopogon vinicolor AM-OR11-026]|uniref:F-box domain-containing protein n=1 Tax=Rhizopogon vinicolor AM-OR11-026 TaxID=1314800 RepID=A0A1B7MY91_9AGAM|nr:hypothetical protein K503DRAFT_225958 [Rhizopogon vinicolor AM-OR11-026]